MPNNFLTIRVDRLEPPPPLTAACAGYEQRRWRCRELARHTLQWLPEFALRYSELHRLDYTNAVARVAECARAVYASKKYQSRGEFGEILLHILLRQHIGTVPVVSKIFFKDSRNYTIKGRLSQCYGTAGGGACISMQRKHWAGSAMLAPWGP